MWILIIIDNTYKIVNLNCVLQQDFWLLWTAIINVILVPCSGIGNFIEMGG